MDLLTPTKAVKLRSHLDKYLTADSNHHTINQTRHPTTTTTTRHSIWLIEPSPLFPTTAIRLKNDQTGLYLAASHEPFLLGWTGKRVVQFSGASAGEGLDWEPIRDGFQVKLRGVQSGSFLRANGGMPPWRNTVTHDMPVGGAGRNWTLWDVEEVEVMFSAVSSFASSPVNSAELVMVVKTPNPGMEFFFNNTNTGIMRLRSHHGKYLTAAEDKKSIKQDRNGSSSNAQWAVELVQSNDTQLIRLKSSYGKYLTASDNQFLLGMTGRRVLQTFLSCRRHPLDSSLEWEPLPEILSTGHIALKLRSARHGSFLRANSGPPPWKKSVTHDVPNRKAAQELILWHVEVVETKQEEVVLALPPPPPSIRSTAKVVHCDSFCSDDSSFRLGLPANTYSEEVQKYSGIQEEENNSLALYSPLPKLDSGGRLIYYHIADENGHVSDDAVEGYSFPFKGNTVEELTQKLEEMTRISDIVLCSRSPLDGKLYPLHLQLPPNNAAIRVLVVKSSSWGKLPPSFLCCPAWLFFNSSVARNFESEGSCD